MSAQRAPVPGSAQAWTEERGPGFRIGWRADWRMELEAAGFRGLEEWKARSSALRGRRALLELDCRGETLLVRRFQHGGWLGGLAGERFWDARRPFVERELCERLRANGVGAPEVVAARARRAPLAGWRLELVMRRIPRARDLEGWLRAEHLEPARRARIAVQLGQFVARVHLLGLWHADLQPKNILVSTDPPGWHLVDLDRSRFHSELSRALRVQNLLRLERAFDKRAHEFAALQLSRSERARCLRAYAREAGLDWRELWRAAQRPRARRVALHRLSWWLERWSAR